MAVRRFFMSSSNDEKQKALGELQEALKDLSSKDGLPLRDRAMVLEAIEKLKGEKS